MSKVLSGVLSPLVFMISVPALAQSTPVRDVLNEISRQAAEVYSHREGSDRDRFTAIVGPQDSQKIQALYQRSDEADRAFIRKSLIGMLDYGSDYGPWQYVRQVASAISDARFVEEMIDAAVSPKQAEKGTSVRSNLTDVVSRIAKKDQTVAARILERLSTELDGPAGVPTKTWYSGTVLENAAWLTQVLLMTPSSKMFRADDPLVVSRERRIELVRKISDAYSREEASGNKTTYGGNRRFLGNLETDMGITNPFDLATIYAPMLLDVKHSGHEIAKKWFDNILKTKDFDRQTLIVLISKGVEAEECRDLDKVRTGLSEALDDLRSFERKMADLDKLIKESRQFACKDLADKASIANQTLKQATEAAENLKKAADDARARLDAAPVRIIVIQAK